MALSRLVVPFATLCLGVRVNALEAEVRADAAVVVDAPKPNYPEPVIIDVNEFLSEIEQQSDGVLTSFLVSEDPKIKVTPNFLTDAEMEHLIEISNLKWSPSWVGIHSDGPLVDDQENFESSVSDYRNSSSSMIDYSETPIVEAIEERLAMLAGVDVNYIEQLAMVRYRPGEIFNEHHDGGFRSNTVFIYLNDLPEDDGGETLFPVLGMKFLPRRGCAVMWSNIDQAGEPNSMMLHQGLPPKTGTKYAVNVFFNTKPQRQVFLEAKALLARSDEWSLIDAEVLEADYGPTPGTLNHFMVFEEPELSVIPRLVSPEEALALRSFAVPGQTPPTQEILDEIFTRMESVTGVPRSSLRVTAGTVASDMMADPLKEPGSEAASEGRLVIFLNDDIERGELLFPGLEARVRPRLGCGVLWSTFAEAGVEDKRLEAFSGPPASKDGAVTERYAAIFRFPPASAVPKADLIEDPPALVEESE